MYPSGGLRVAAETEGFVGPGIGRSGYRSMSEFSDAVAVRYQALYEQGHAITMQRVAQGLVRNDRTAIGAEIDTFARQGLRRWLSNAEGITEGPGRMISVNRRLYDPAGSGIYCQPDVYIPGARTIFDGTIAPKTPFSAQSINFRSFSGGANVVIVRPTAEGGSYGLFFR